MQLLNFEVRQDWLEFERRQMADYPRLWWAIQIVVILSTIAAFLLTLVQLAWPWSWMLRVLSSITVFYALSLWLVYRTQTGAVLRTLLVTLLLILTTALAAITVVQPVAGQAGGYRSAAPYPLILLVPVISGSILMWSWRKFPVQMNRMGITSENWRLNLAIGGIAGAVLGLHFLVSTFLLTSSGPFRPAGFPILTWNLGYQMGLAAIGEELLLRGLSFLLLYKGSRNNLFKTALQIGFLNILICLVPFSQAQPPFWWIWMAVYHLAFSFLATYLRYRQGSLLPSLASNIVFHTLVALVFQW